MELVFPFLNIATNFFLRLTDERENIGDFILTKQEKYPYSENYFLRRVDHFKDSLPNFENEILQTINTTNQVTIDEYFHELVRHVDYIQQKISLEQIEAAVKKWNEESLKAFDEKVEKETEDYFKSEDRKRKHLEKWDDWDYGGLFELTYGFKRDPKKISRINYNYYCIEKQPELIDEAYCKQYQIFLEELANQYLEVAKRYGIPYSKGEIISKVEKTIFNKPVVFVEGEHDITYIVRAAELLNKKELLEKVELRQRGGWSNLDKIWDIYKDNNWETVPQKKLLLYDCDIKKQDADTGTVYKRVIKTVPENIVSKGIENLFPKSIIEKAIQKKRAFIDVTRVHRIKRGKRSREVAYTVNEDEKKHFCAWICENGTAEDFIHFQEIFELISIVI